MNKPKIGWFCSYTPVEILEAAGLEPYGIRVDSGKGHEDVYLGDSMCSYVRSCLGGALSGEYDFLDRVAIAHSCECMRRLYDGWEFKRGDIKPGCLHLLDVPRVYTEKSVDFFASEIERFKLSVEAVYGKITRHSLHDAVLKSLHTSRLLSIINGARKRYNTPITGTEVQKIMAKKMTSPRDIFNAELEAFIANLGSGDGRSGRPRIMIYGGPVNAMLVEAIEEADGIVVYEHICNGIRQVRNDENPEEDPIRYLAESYLSKPSCPRMIGEHSIFGLSEIKRLVREYRVDGIIYYSIKFCSNAQAFWPMFKDILYGIVPVKMLEGDVSPDMNIREVHSFVKKLSRRVQQHDTGKED